jgi:23S rRNA pseudouridine2605 synthase
VYPALGLMRRANHRTRTGIARALSKVGFCSRSQASKLVSAGRVCVNGRIIRDPEHPVQIEKDTIQVDGQNVEPAAKVYLMMNKPRGFVTTADDEQGRKTVYSLLPNAARWVAPVGRLDKASEGLLLFTNDSDWAARITNPENHIEKRYHAQISAVADQTLLDRLTTGCRAAEGDFLRVKRATLIRTGRKNSWVEIVLHEGKNRHIRRLLAALNVEVLRLVRIAIGRVTLAPLARGAIRELTQEEIAALNEWN